MLQNYVPMFDSVPILTLPVVDFSRKRSVNCDDSNIFMNHKL